MSTTSPLVVIVGASGRLGSAAAIGFLSNGYHVVGIDRLASSDGAFPILSVNAIDESSVQMTFEAIRSEYGVPRVVIQTVGMWAMAPFAETTLSDWKQLIDVNLTTTFLIFREAVRLMTASGGLGGTLIGITSRQGSERGVSQQAAYSAAKAGVVRMVEAIADEYATSTINAHALAPSTILFGSENAQGGVQVEDLVAHCLYLCSDAGGSLNGATIHAYG